MECDIIILTSGGVCLIRSHGLLFNTNLYFDAAANHQQRYVILISNSRFRLKKSYLYNNVVLSR